MHTSLYEDVGSKYGLERGGSIDGRRLDEEEEVYWRRCLMFAIGTVKKQNEKKSYIR